MNKGFWWCNSKKAAMIQVNFNFLKYTGCLVLYKFANLVNPEHFYTKKRINAKNVIVKILNFAMGNYFLWRILFGVLLIRLIKYTNVGSRTINVKGGFIQGIVHVNRDIWVLCVKSVSSILMIIVRHLIQKKISNAFLVKIEIFSF